MPFDGLRNRDEREDEGVRKEGRAKDGSMGIDEPCTARWGGERSPSTIPESWQAKLRNRRVRGGETIGER